MFVFINILDCKLVKVCFGRDLPKCRFGRNVAEIGQIIYYLEWSLTSDEVGPEKTCVNAEIICRNRRERKLVLEKE